MEKLALALINAARKLRPYFQSHQVVVLTNYPLKQILRSPETSRRLAKWAIELSGAGIVLTNPGGDEFEYAQRFESIASNNVAEYEALIAGIRLALAAGARKLLIQSDSQIVVNQVLGVYEAKEDTMAKYLALTHTLLSKFESYEIKQVPRSNNVHADKLARLGSSMASIGSQKVTLLTSPQPEITSPTEIQYTKEDEPCWFTPILKYLKKGELPMDPTEARKLKTRAVRFVIVGEELYKRGFSFPYLKCLDPTTADYVLREVHEGICGNHLSGRTLALKLLRQGYYWPTMHEDAKKLVEELPNALWAYRTTPRAATGESPFNLAFGTEVIAPVEIGEPSWRITNYDPAANEEAMRGSLDLVDELREIAYIRQQMYKSRMAKAYNSKVRPRSFQVGDLVLRKDEASHPIGKLDPKWEGPYKVTKVVNTGAYRLENIDGHPIPRTWNIGNLKRFYA
ncbi:PREDICTED: uncharacterized protein LOC105959678 [Erythranthe guttata]|uniref:uncharacterized protein LOC105959678 n=1 Tax=Erythranthe guttata TaxID=4155 RepID=UPI00064DAAB6|nr:PREDICTED: uncharacterized protein LOC105959678 [Erythranthe guttata]|eukprot:XP_012839272.1 PREDICTED: uncharacterized protein LOC105959678 [Erythranthe guttata]